MVGEYVMYISELTIEGYRNSKHESVIRFKDKLNILVGENASGKSSIIDAIRLILKDPDQSYVTEDDFYNSFYEDNITANNIKIDLKFEGLSEEQKITFLTWCDDNFNAELHLEIDKKPNQKGYYKKSIWGGKSKTSAFEEEVFDYINIVYLPPLRDAEEKLRNGRKSKLAQLINSYYIQDERKKQLEDVYKELHKSIINDKDNKFSEINQVKNNINKTIEKSLGSVFGQTINLQFSELNFNSIIRNIKMVFFPHRFDNVPDEKFRDIAINSLGYNNLLFIATVFAELEFIKDNSNMFTVLLIEEPEAHLHPQLQIKLIKYLEDILQSIDNIQIIVTTHSPVIASSVDIDNIIHIKADNDKIVAKKIYDFKLPNDTKMFLNRWMDVTKSTLLFSRGVILVEGISEAILIPSFAEKVLEEYNSLNEDKLPNNLEEAGITVVNIGGRFFEHFHQLFTNLDNNEERLPIRCSGITDKDPKPVKNDNSKESEKDEAFSTTSDNEEYESGNYAVKLLEKLKKSKNSKLFVSEIKTFEYDLAMNGNLKLMAEIIKDKWDTKTNNSKVKNELDSIINKNNDYENDEDRRSDAMYIFNHINSTKVGKGLFAQELYIKLKQGANINIPNYIKKAIIWACGGKVNEQE